MTTGLVINVSQGKQIFTCYWRGKQNYPWALILQSGISELQIGWVGGRELREGRAS